MGAQVCAPGGIRRYARGGPVGTGPGREVRAAAFLACAALAAAGGCGGGGGGWKDAHDARFRTGQRWSYEARKGEEGSTALVTGVGRHPEKGVVIHAEVSGISLFNAGKGAPEPGVVRIALTRDAFGRSVRRLVRDGERVAPEIREGLAAWYREGTYPDDRTIVQVIDQFDASMRSSAGN